MIVNIAFFFLIFCAASLNCGNGLPLEENKVSLTEEEFPKDNLPFCEAKKDIAELRNLLVGLQKELNDMKTDFGKEIKAISKFLREEKSSKNISVSPAAENQCVDALYFRGYNTFEYAISHTELATYDDEDYASGSGVPEKALDAITSCFWIKTQKPSYTGSPNVISYAVHGRDNEFTVFLEPAVTVLLKTKIGYSFHPYNTGVLVSDDKWHHVCITWESTRGVIQVYKDGILKNSSIGFKPGKSIAPFGIWIIGQEQDRYGGGFQINDAFRGYLTDVNIWDRVLKTNEILTLANQCGSGMKGNYKAYDDFVPRGGVRKYKPSCCD